MEEAKIVREEDEQTFLDQQRESKRQDQSEEGLLQTPKTRLPCFADAESESDMVQSTHAR